MTRVTNDVDAIQEMFASGALNAVGDLVRLVVSKTGFSGRIHFDHSQPDGQPRRCLDVSRAQKELNFRATTLIDDGLRETIEWFYKHASTV